MLKELTKEEKDYIVEILRILTFNLADCVKLLKYCEPADSKKDIVRDTLQMDLEYLAKLESFVKGKFNIGE